VTAAQRSPDLFSYRMTPSLDLVAPDGPPASYGYEVLVEPGARTKSALRIYSCRKRLRTSRWFCEGPYTQIGMGTINQLLGPYPPQALVLGLDNASVTYTGVPAPAAIRPEPAFLIVRRRSGWTLRCLEFGPTRHPVGSVCLRPDGLIASYRLSVAATFSVYETARLRSYLPHVPREAFDLPARPGSAA
jgi:hypothetical protein